MNHRKQGTMLLQQDLYSEPRTGHSLPREILGQGEVLFSLPAGLLCL
jgi:hypothetical protein